MIRMAVLYLRAIFLKMFLILMKKSIISNVV